MTTAYDQPARYRAKAQQLRAMAEVAADRSQKDELLALVRQYEVLADEFEQHQTRH